mmetsp:Transcript_903/g.953  ORF Transcript_903/g.953 Transcript_903/m.953 type:complete len:201 (-) Transcript_903:36-638(-)
MIEEYMLKQNRPYSVINVCDNLHGKIKKAQVQKLMDNLSAEKKLTCKEFGKAKVYLVDQSQFPEYDAEELATLDKEIEQAKNVAKELTEKSKSLQQSLKNIKTQYTDAELDALLIEKREKTKKMQDRYDSLTSGQCEQVSEDQIDKRQKEVNKYQTEWRRRKRIVKDIISTMAEGMEKKPADLYKLIGLETDEECNAVCP